MPVNVTRPCRIAVIGASSLRGKDLTQLLEDRSFPVSDIRLIDDEVAAGTLAEAGGEATFIHAMESGSFERVDFAFFAGVPELTMRHWREAYRAGATVVDLSGAFADVPEALPWIPSLDAVFAPPPDASEKKLFFSLPAATQVACTLAVALQPLDVVRLSIVFLQPVSECGQPGIDELESQTVNLLSFQPIPQTVYDAQVAFNLLTRYGAGSKEHLDRSRAAISRGAARYLAGRAPVPAIQLVQAPVFYSYAFTAFTEFSKPQEAAKIQQALSAVGLRVAPAGDAPPNNVSVAGESLIMLGRVEPDACVPSGYWLWGAVDNVRLGADNAVRIAEKLIAS